MSNRSSFRKSKLADWGFRLSVVSAHIVVFTVIFHRFAGQSTAVALNLLQIGFVGAFVALIISLIGAVQIWNRLLSGFGKAVFGVFLSLLVLAWPLSQLPRYLISPPIYDVSTDLTSPPPFQDLVAKREFGSNSTDFVKQATFAEDVRPLRIKKSGQDAFDLVRQLVLKRKWELVAIKPLDKNTNVGYIEAVDYSYILAVPDDIVLRIKAKGKETILDMRSASRYGSFDLGRNQQRIQNFFNDLITQNTDIDLVGKPSSPLHVGKKEN